MSAPTLFWMRFYAVEPLRDPPPSTFFCTGQTLEEPERFIYCVLVEASSADEAWSHIDRFATVDEPSFANRKDAEFLQDLWASGRFDGLKPLARAGSSLEASR